MKPLAAARFKLKLLPLEKPKASHNIPVAARARYLERRRDGGQFLDSAQKRELAAYDQYREAREAYDAKRAAILLEIAALQTASDLE